MDGAFRIRSQGGGGQEEGLGHPGGEEPEGGRGIPLRLHPGAGEGPDPARAVGTSSRLPTEQGRAQQS